MKRRLSSLFIVFMVLAPLAVAIDQQPAAKAAPAAETGVKPDCSKSNILNTACGRCGDGQCVKSCGETATSCPADCGGGGVPKKS